MKRVVVVRTLLKEAPYGFRFCVHGWREGLQAKQSL